MKRSIYDGIGGIVLIILLFMGCSKDEVIDNPVDNATGRAIALSGEIDQVLTTRVNDGGFVNNDEMGVYIVDYQGGNPGELLDRGNRANNVRFTFDEPNYKWNAAYDIYWKDGKTPIDVYGYYPFGAPSSVKSYAFEVAKDQSKAAANGNLGGYEASDFLWGKAANVAPTTPLIRIAFRHKMSNIRVDLVEGSGFAEDEWSELKKEILVSNTRRKANINLTTGEVVATGEVATTGIIPYKKDNQFRAIVVPQAIAAGTRLFNITVGGVVYNFKKESDFTYVPAKMHNFTITVDKKENSGDYTFTLISESITAWENDDISHDAMAKEYIVIESTAGQLKQCIIAAQKDFRQLQNLKITGEINALDFYFMRDTMNRLQALNLKEVKICEYKSEYGQIFNADEIPEMAFHQKRTLQSIVLPDILKAIHQSAFNECTSLSGSLYIPEGVTQIGVKAFHNCFNLRGVLSLPTTLEVLGTVNQNHISGYVFYQCGFTCELKLPDKLKYIGDGSFAYCGNLYGSLVLPENLEYIGLGAFQSCMGLTGNLKIPQKISTIPSNAFSFCHLGGTLELHNGITSIEENAFRDNFFQGELILPDKLSVLASDAFSSNNFSGELKLPQGLLSIGNNTFEMNQQLTGTLEFPPNIQNIGRYAFLTCSMIEKIIFPENIESIGTSAFANCFGVGSIVCKNSVPPYVLSEAFAGITKDGFTLEVPESAIVQYQTAPEWKEFKRISAHHELVCRPAMVTALNAQHERRLILNAEGDWEVESMPDWCTLSQRSGSKKTELTLTIGAMAHGSASREGEIVFSLKEKEYTTRCQVSQFDYNEDEDEIITLQTHSKGNGINLVFLGDGFNAEEVSQGNYLQIMKEQVERFFDIEPYRTYRNYFDVYTAIVASPESGVGTVNTVRNTRFGTTFTGGVGLTCNYDDLFAYVLQFPGVTQENLNRSLIVVTPNSREYGGVCQMWEDGSAIAFCPLSNHDYPMDSRGLIQHEAGGHGFGKLGDEYIYHNEFIRNCCCGAYGALQWGKSCGWYDNLSLSGKMHEVPWSHLIFDKRYSAVVDVFEGGYMHTRGVFRSEQNSCMNNNVPYFSTISRESIVKRIKRYAGETYSYEDFVANDKMSNAPDTRGGDKLMPGVNARTYQHAPMIHRGRPLE